MPFFGSIKAGSTEVSLPINLGAATGLIHTNIVFKFWRQGDAPVVVALTPIAAVDDPWLSAGWIEVSAAAVPAVYRLDVPDAAFVGEADWVEIIVSDTAGDAWYVERFSLTMGGLSAEEPTVDKQTAADRVALLTSASSFPVVSNDEVLALLDQCVIASVWAPSTSYKIGDSVIPTADNQTGYVYTLLDSWTNPSGVTEPTWPRWDHGYVADNGLIWQIRGSAPGWLWDLNQCQHLVYKLKLAKAQELYNVGLDGRDKFDRRGIVENLQDMVERTAPFCAA